jgi:hypothetical protein
MDKTGETSLNANDPSKWADLAGIRDQINRFVYPAEASRSLVPFLVGGVLFIGILEVARSSVDTLVFQFVLGAILLFALQNVLRRIQNVREPLLDGSKCTTVCHGLSSPLLGLLQSQLEMRAERVKEFPIQQNALLAIALILLPNVDDGTSRGGQVRIAVECAFGISYFVLKKWEDSRNRTHHWIGASRAVREALISWKQKAEGTPRSPLP